VTESPLAKQRDVMSRRTNSSSDKRRSFGATVCLVEHFQKECHCAILTLKSPRQKLVHVRGQTAEQKPGLKNLEAGKILVFNRLPVTIGW